MEASTSVALLTVEETSNWTSLAGQPFRRARRRHRERTAWTAALAAACTVRQKTPRPRRRNAAGRRDRARTAEKLNRVVTINVSIAMTMVRLGALREPVKEYLDRRGGRRATADRPSDCPPDR